MKHHEDSPFYDIKLKEIKFSVTDDGFMEMARNELEFLQEVDQDKTLHQRSNIRRAIFRYLRYV